MVKVNRGVIKNTDAIRLWLDTMYDRFHRPEFIGTDPLLFVHRYSDPLDQEICGLIASSLAYGNVTSINQSISLVLNRMAGQPRHFLLSTPEREWPLVFSGFRHRWTSDTALIALLLGIKRVIRETGSLGQAFRVCDKPGQDIAVTLAAWVRWLQPEHAGTHKLLLAYPERNSACKRLYLYLRWMVRQDEIDVGCWSGISPERLVVPLDTHIYGLAKAMGLTRRASADGKTAREITDAFCFLRPDDPIRYDFALTRPGIMAGWRPGREQPWLMPYES